MKKTLVKYKSIEDHTDTAYIEAIFPNSAVETLQLLKIVDSIKLGEDSYKYVSCEFKPALEDEDLDVLLVYVDGYED